MNSLLGYGSDDDYDDSSEEKQTDPQGSTKGKLASNKQTDVNYEEVQMDLSEDSNDSPKPQPKEPERRRERRDHSRHRRSDRDREGKSSRGDHRRGRDKRRRSPSRERRRSRSPKRGRSRSRSHERSRRPPKRYERAAKSEPERVEKVVGPVEQEKSAPPEGNRFFMPGISGRFRDQIEKRKQLWQKKPVEPSCSNGQSKKVWEATTFAQDTDGKVANKFKRLMGIRGPTGSSGHGVDGLKKQEEMFSSMEQQYEVARTATHTMRGVGLGFGSFNR